MRPLGLGLILLFSFVGASGEPIWTDEGEFMIDTSVANVAAPAIRDEPDVAFDGTNYFLVWHDERGGTYDIFGARVTPAGQVLDRVGIAISSANGHQRYPAVAFDGTNYLVVWQDERYSGLDIMGARVSTAGELLDPEGITISVAPRTQWYPDVAFDGNNFHVVWMDERDGLFDIFGARVATDGRILDPGGFVISAAVDQQRRPKVAAENTNVLVIWEDRRVSGGGIYAARVNPNGQVLDPDGIGVVTRYGGMSAPALVFVGQHYMAVWEDWSSGSARIRGARIATQGVVLDPDGITVTAGNGSRWRPDIAFDGDNCLVVWCDERNRRGDIYGARVTPDGTVLNPSGIEISTAGNGQWSPAVAAADSNLLVVWADDRSRSREIYFTRMTPAGSVLDPNGIAPVQTGNSQDNPDVAFDGTNYLVVYEDHRDGSDIYGARVTPEGVVLDPVGFRIRRGTGGQYQPAVVFGGANYLVVWQDGASTGSDVHGARVTPDGTVLDTDPIRISTANRGQYNVDVAFNGEVFLVVWEDGRNHEYYADVYGARVTQDGDVLDAGIAIAREDDSQYDPSVAALDSVFLVAWQDRRGGTFWDVMATRVSGAGQVMDPNGIGVSLSTDDKWQVDVSVSDDNYLVVWQDRRIGAGWDVYGARLTPDGTVLDPDGIVLAGGFEDQQRPKAAFNGSEFVVCWEHGREGLWDVNGAFLMPGGMRADTFRVVREDANQQHIALTNGPGTDVMLAFQGWAAEVNGRAYNADRIWGKLSPLAGAHETGESGSVRPWEGMPTVVRGSLLVPDAPMTGYRTPMLLLDIGGRRVMVLKPGTNDVAHLSPGVYFVRVGGEARGPGEKILVQK